jgi:hypothetical protein
VNHAPTAQNGTLTTDEDVAKGVTLQASDPDGDALTYSIVAAPGHGLLSGVAPTLTYTPTPGYSGPDSFTFKVNDGSLDSNTATVSITVNHVNHAPTAQNGTLTTDEDVAKTMSLQASDPDADALSYAIVSAPGHGSLSGTAPALTYTPAPNYNGPDSFTFKVNDGHLQSNVATVSITVTPVNDQPVAHDDTATTNVDVALVLHGTTLLANDTDVDGDALSVVEVQQTGDTHGTVTLVDGDVHYVPDLHFVGPAQFRYSVADGHGGTGSAAVNVNVTPVLATAPRVLKQDVLRDLIALRSTVSDKKSVHKLDEAIDKLRDSLDPALWLDSSHPRAKRGNKVFQKEKQCVHKLQELMKDKKSTIADATLQGLIDRLVAIDRMLAAIAIDEASSGKLTELEKAKDELAKGDADALKGKPDKAIGHYRKAWKHALEATKRR